jgi:transglutaminase-like putative cysteine protease
MTRRSEIATTLVFIGGLLLVAADAPLWCVGVAAAAAAWRLVIALRGKARPNPGKVMRIVFGIVTAIFVGAVLMSFRTLNGLGAGTALLVLMGALKLIEARTRRDDAIVIGVALFLLLAATLADQSLWRVPLYLLQLWGVIAAMALVAHGGTAFTPRAALRLSARTLAMSVPLAALAFLFFPRFAGQFWALERGGQASTGLTDEMAPGSIGSLAIEYDPAFRVHFEGAPPPRAALYFRGPVLNSFDGFTWRREHGRSYPREEIEVAGPPVRYRITLEPSYRRFMVTLDTIVEPPRRGVFFAHDRQLTAIGDITQVRSYDAISYLRVRSTTPLSASARRYETRLDTDHNPRARALALEIRARSGSDAEYSRAVLDWFGRQGLEYTLDPGRTSVDSVDSTLFDNKRGFCAHFASAYAMMMRAAGVPARVVTGYLGGEWNPAGNYLIVRQSDAHAWTEVWLDGEGWTRIDPTVVVAPERLQRGIFDVLRESLPATSFIIQRNNWMHRIALAWDGANQWWQQRVVEFTLRSQFELLSKLGIGSPDWKHLGWIFALVLCGWIAWVSITLRRSVARVKPDRIGRSWLRFTRKLARVAPPRSGDEGPYAFAARIAGAKPELAVRVQAIAARYARLRFGAAPARAEIEEFERETRAFG